MKLHKEMQAIQNFPALKEIIQENEQIGVAVNKMAKMIIKKLKKEDVNALKDIKQYLNTDQTINCDAAMKSLLG